VGVDEGIADVALGLSSKFKAQSSREAPNHKIQAPEPVRQSGLGAWELKLIFEF
jgi:hypothetical protein